MKLNYLLLGALFIIACNISEAQTGDITGRVVYEDGGGAPNVSVTLISVKTRQQAANSGTPADKVITDEDGKFKFTGLKRGVYAFNVSGSKGYVKESEAEAQEQRRYRIGDNVTITLIRGGVITGRVTTADGEPMIGVRVYPVIVRDADGQRVRRQSGARPRMTDDRGVYRIYGLEPGTYVVYARSESLVAPVSPYEGNVATYHPSSTRDTAIELNVASGAEVGGVDIRYHGARGRAVSGTVAGIKEPRSMGSFAQVSLANLSTGQVLAIEGVNSANAFAIYGVPDGEYEISARRTDFNSAEILASAPRRVTVRGVDVTGIELRLAPMASISGKILFEAAQNSCENERKATLEEVALSARRDSGQGVETSDLLAQEGAANDRGEFSIYNLQAGRYFIESKLPSENWFVKSITAIARGAAGSSASTDIARGGVSLKSGEKLIGVTLTVAGGGASLRGKVAAESEGAKLPSSLRIHLVPAEATARDEVLRYAEASVRGDGTFALNNIAPGKYWLIARAAPDDEPGDKQPMPVALDANERVKLRREAEALKIEVEMKPCQRLIDQVIKYYSK
jgi:hypothetical protein